jgi:DNA processing protein
MPREARRNAARRLNRLQGVERQIVELVLAGVDTPETILDCCNLSVPRIMSTITMLELDGILHREKGKLILNDG